MKEVHRIDSSRSQEIMCKQLKAKERKDSIYVEREICVRAPACDHKWQKRKEKKSDSWFSLHLRFSFCGNFSHDSLEREKKENEGPRYLLFLLFIVRFCSSVRSHSVRGFKKEVSINQRCGLDRNFGILFLSCCYTVSCECDRTRIVINSWFVHIIFIEEFEEFKFWLFTLSMCCNFESLFLIPIPS